MVGFFIGGGKEDRTPDLMIANHSLSQLSYTPIKINTITGRAQALSCLVVSLIAQQLRVGHSFFNFVAESLHFPNLITKLRRLR